MSKSNVRVRVPELSPIIGAGFVHRRRYTASSWRAVDCVQDDGSQFRVIYHYGTRMCEFARIAAHEPWVFLPLSVGYGSVSDQQGMNRILWGTGWRYRRDSKGGGPRYISPEGEVW